MSLLVTFVYHIAEIEHVYIQSASDRTIIKNQTMAYIPYMYIMYKVGMHCRIY